MNLISDSKSQINKVNIYSANDCQKYVKIVAISLKDVEVRRPMSCSALGHDQSLP